MAGETPTSWATCLPVQRCRRSATMRSAIDATVACGIWEGREERSTMPASPRLLSSARRSDVRRAFWLMFIRTRRCMLKRGNSSLLRMEPPESSHLGRTSDTVAVPSKSCCRLPLGGTEVFPRNRLRPSGRRLDKFRSAPLPDLGDGQAGKNGPSIAGECECGLSMALPKSWCEADVQLLMAHDGRTR